MYSILRLLGNEKANSTESAPSAPSAPDTSRAKVDVVAWAPTNTEAGVAIGHAGVKMGSGYMGFWPRPGIAPVFLKSATIQTKYEEDKRSESPDGKTEREPERQVTLSVTPSQAAAMQARADKLGREVAKGKAYYQLFPSDPVIGFFRSASRHFEVVAEDPFSGTAPASGTNRKDDVQAGVKKFGRAKPYNCVTASMEVLSAGGIHVEKNAFFPETPTGLARKLERHPSATASVDSTAAPVFRK